MIACEAVLDNWCTAPPQLEDAHTRGVCFGCGLPVCVSCSKITDWYTYGKKRICANCLQQHGAGYLVAEMLWYHAGYNGLPPKHLVESMMT